MDFWISDWISGFQIGFLDFTVDFWISVWISADSVRDFFCNGPLAIASCLRRKDTRLSQRYIFAFLESLGTRLQNTWVLKKFVLYSPDPPPFLLEVLLRVWE